MPILHRAKLISLRAAARLGINALLLGSRWRRERLLLLCYHGISLDDEHQWSPAMYMPPALLRERMAVLRRLDCTVLPLSDALSRLYSGSLPPRAAAITFDDGAYDFYRAAEPILREFNYPATVYLTTYYAGYNRPVFDVMLGYLLWKGRNQTLECPEFLDQPALLDESGLITTQSSIRDRVLADGYSAERKDELLASLARKLGIDYQALCVKRILHLMTAEEARELAAKGVDIQLHTHRHRMPRDATVLSREIEDNRRAIASITPTPAVHFCYPCGEYWPEVAGHLAASGIESATTCDPGLCSRLTDRFYLPRFLDSSLVTEAEFEAGLSGLRDLLPRRRLQ